MFDFDAKTGEGSGRWRLGNGNLVDFLPEEPGNSPPYELVSTTEPNADSADGHTHYLVGGDAETVKLIVAFYAKQGKKVPYGYEAEAAAHAAAVEAAKKPA